MNRLLLPLFGIVLLAAPALGQVPGTLSYQGYLEENGSPVNGNRDLTFRLYAAPTGGSALWTETQPSVTVAGGVFAVALGAVTPLSGLAFDAPYWLSVQVAGGGELAPRTALLSAPYARRAAAAETVALPFAGSTGSGTTALSATHTAPSGTTSGVYGESASPNGFGLRGDAPYVGVYGTGDNTGVWGQAEGAGTNWGVYGQTASAAGTGVYGGASATSGTTYGVYGESASPGGRGLFGRATATSGIPVGVVGETHSPTGYGVFGHGLSTTGANYGVVGRSDSPAGAGVYGVNVATNGVSYGGYFLSFATGGHGVYGHALATSQANYGVLGRSDSPAGRGVYGTATATTGQTRGVYGVSASAEGRGVEGYASASSGVSYGVYGQTASITGVAVRGQATATGGGAHGGVFTTSSFGGRGVEGRASHPDAATYGGYFTSASTHPLAAGVYGYAPAGVGGRFGSAGTVGVAVQAEVFGSGNSGTAVHGRNGSSSGYAGYFDGRAHVTGTLSKGGGSFVIDHPLDPEGRLLRHSFVESPDMMNVYNGNATLDRNGEAEVALPAWFEALNRDFRYQLTCIGGHAPVYVAEEVRGNRFRIAGGTPGLRVSWQVTGVRQDAWANENRIVVEEDKPANQQGRYLHPSAFGQPRERGVDHDPEREEHSRERLLQIEREHLEARQEDERARQEAERMREEAERVRQEAERTPAPLRPGER